MLEAGGGSPRPIRRSLTTPILATDRANGTPPRRSAGSCSPAMVLSTILRILSSLDGRDGAHIGVLSSTRRVATTTLHVKAARRSGERRNQPTEIGPPVDLFEYQAKELFAEYGVPVLKDKVAGTAEEAREITTAFAADGIPQVVVKAQVKTGGRGKAGGVEIEEIAHTNPDAIARIPVSPLTGVNHEKAMEIIKAGRIPEEAAEQRG